MVPANLGSNLRSLEPQNEPCIPHVKPLLRFHHPKTLPPSREPCPSSPRKPSLTSPFFCPRQMLNPSPYGLLTGSFSLSSAGDNQNLPCFCV
jgi:hypothetical protein